MDPRRVLMTGARGKIGRVLRPGLRDGLEELRLSDRGELGSPLVGPETYVDAELADFDAVARAVEGVDAVVHLGAIPNEAAFEVIAGPNLYGAFHVYEACRRAGVKRVVFASSNHATGMYASGEQIDPDAPTRPDGIYGASKVYGEALGSMFADKFGLEVVCLRIGSFQPQPREIRELSTWISFADTLRLVQAALTADDVHFEIVYGVSANTRRWWPLENRIGFVPLDDAEAYAGELGGPDYPYQGGPNSSPSHGGWAT